MFLWVMDAHMLNPPRLGFISPSFQFVLLTWSGGRGHRRILHADFFGAALFIFPSAIHHSPDLSDQAASELIQV